MGRKYCVSEQMFPTLAGYEKDFANCVKNRELLNVVCVPSTMVLDDNDPGNSGGSLDDPRVGINDRELTQQEILELVKYYFGGKIPSAEEMRDFLIAV
ncbi:hypothetical protein DFQ26_008823 [Actinomortierella ambigua]|nr:hypothetical protein DFQ26_008823 [Actinomortierella ambigua]